MSVFFNEAPLFTCAVSSIATLHQQGNRLCEADVPRSPMARARPVGEVKLTVFVPGCFAPIHQDVDLVAVRINYRWGGPVTAKY